MDTINLAFIRSNASHWSTAESEHDLSVFIKLIHQNGSKSTMQVVFSEKEALTAFMDKLEKTNENFFHSIDVCKVINHRLVN